MSWTGRGAPRRLARLGWSGAPFLWALFFTAAPADAQILQGDPGNYPALLGRLKPGDTLQLAAGEYAKGLPVHGLCGQPGKPIVISGPEKGAPAVFTARGGHDTVEVFGSSYVEIRNLELDGKGLEVHGVNARAGPGPTHDITVENLTIKNHGANQQIVGISTNQTPTWNWVIRGNVIVGAGTGMYLGNSDGKNPFVNGLLEYNLVVDTIGYNIQLKHQLDRPQLPGMPAKGRTIIRHNVFSKQTRPPGRSDGTRPNVLIGHFPESGDGAEDLYLIYGNFFYQNDSDQPLFQGEGNLALYNNLFVNTLGTAVQIGRHNGRPKKIWVFHNTVVAKNGGIRIGGGDPAFKQTAFGNAVFAPGGVGAPAAADNLVASYDAAAQYLSRPDAKPGELDLFPKPGKLQGKATDLKAVAEFQDAERDFNGAKQAGNFRGAYAGEGRNTGWLPKLERKPLKSPYEVMAGPGPYRKLEPLAAQVRSGQNLGQILKTLRAKLQSADPEEAAEARLLFAGLNEEAERQLKEAAELKEKAPAAALAAYEKTALAFAGDQTGQQAAKESAGLRSHPKVREEAAAAQLLAQLEAYAERFQPFQGKKDPAAEGFRKLNQTAIGYLISGCRGLIQRYPHTQSAKKAEELLNLYK